MSIIYYSDNVFLAYKVENGTCFMKPLKGKEEDEKGWQPLKRSYFFKEDHENHTLTIINAKNGALVVECNAIVELSENGEHTIYL
jgi:hypothetical protein